MTVFGKVWQHVIGWFKRLTHRDYYRVVQVSDTPDKLQNKRFYLVGEDDFIWSGVMLCPCGCQETIHLNLLPDGKPKWKHHINNNKAISIHPSIWRTKGCKSHFFLKNGNIKWCKRGAEK